MSEETQPRGASTPRLVSLERAAELLGVGRTTAYALARQHRIETLHIGRRRVVVVASIDAFIMREREREHTQEEV